MFGGLPAADVLDIHEVLSRYGYVMDNREWDRFGDVFTQDGVLDLSHHGMWVARGLAAITERFATLTHPRGHHTTNTVMVVQPDGTVGLRSKYLAVVDDHEMSVGDYHDTAARTTDGWRLTSRALIPRFRIKTPLL